MLLADDSKTNRKLLRAAFTKHCNGAQWTFAEAATGECALELCKQQGFDLIVMDEIFDLGHTLMRGTQAIVRMRDHERESGKAVPAAIVLCTGNVKTAPPDGD